MYHQRCPPCKQFTPILVNFHKEADKLGVKVIFVSSDSDANSFLTYFQKMSWYALPFPSQSVKQKLSKLFHIRGIPAVVVLDAKSGYFITDNGRNDVLQTGGRNSDQIKAVVDGWKATEAVPLDQATFGQANPGFFMNILKNPLQIALMYYVFKFIFSTLTGNA